MTLVGTAGTAVAAEPGFNPYGPQGSVYRLYQAAFLREPDTGGFQYWERVNAGGVPMRAIAQSFVDSNEFRARYQSLDDRGFVRLVYRNVLEREPDEGGYQHWTTAMANGMPRGALLLAFSESEEFVAKTYTGHPPGYRWLDPFTIAGNYITHDGSRPPAFPRCTGLMSLCLGDHIDKAYARLGTPSYDAGGQTSPRSVVWNIGAAQISIDFRSDGRAVAFSAHLLNKSGTLVALTRDLDLGLSTFDEAGELGNPVYDVEFSEDCAYESHGYVDDRSTAEGMGERIIRFGTSDCPFTPEYSWYPVLSWVTIDDRR